MPFSYALLCLVSFLSYCNCQYIDTWSFTANHDGWNLEQGTSFGADATNCPSGGSCVEFGSNKDALLTMTNSMDINHSSF